MERVERVVDGGGARGRCGFGLETSLEAHGGGQASGLLARLPRRFGTKRREREREAPTRADCSDAELGPGESNFGNAVIGRWTVESVARKLHRVVAGCVAEGGAVLLKHRVETSSGS